MKKLIVGALLASFTTPALAALPEGWYNGWETFINLLKPPKADRPVTSQEREGDYPLISNPANFKDGYKPNLFGKWQEIKLHPSTGAICGNGTPFKFYFRRVADNRNLTINLEPGGACWDYASCTGQTGIRGARNPNGIPDNYIQKVDINLLTPFIARVHYDDNFEAQQWNKVFIPYCTGDIYAGDKTVVYDDPTGENPPLTWHHRGFANVRAVISWLRDNMQQPAQMVTTGCSAGGTGSLVNYHFLRENLAPSQSYLINDSGPIFNASTSEDPSYPLHQRIREAWGLDPLIQRMADRIPHFSADNLGTIYQALAVTYPDDRLAHTHFYQDYNYSIYSYERFYDDIVNELDPEKRKQKILAKWHQDTENLIEELDRPELANWAYYIPNYRSLNDSHCTTIVEFNGSDIQEDRVQPELGHFIDSVMDRSQPMTSSVERDLTADFKKPRNLFYELINSSL